MVRLRISHAHTRTLSRAVAAFTAVLVAGSAVSAAAAEKTVCYSRAEHAAEQLIRLHTELMVIGLSCQSIAPAENPFGKYQQFTVKNDSLLSNATKVLEGHFRKVASGNPSRRFDTFRTELANEISRRASIIGTSMYCQEFVGHSKNAIGLSPDDIRTLTGDEKKAGLLYLASQPLCDVKVASLPDSALKAPVEPARGKKPADAKAPAKPATSKPAAKPATAKPADSKPAAKPVTTAQKS